MSENDSVYKILDDAARMRVVITKNQHRGWSCRTYVRYPDWPGEAVTGTGYETLESALWHAVLDCIDLGAELLSVTVNGENMPLSEVQEKVSEALAGGALAYRLNDIEKLLEATNE